MIVWLCSKCANTEAKKVDHELYFLPIDVEKRGHASPKMWTENRADWIAIVTALLDVSGHFCSLSFLLLTNAWQRCLPDNKISSQLFPCKDID